MQGKLHLIRIGEPQLILRKDIIESELIQRPLRWRIVILAETSSTMDAARELVEKGGCDALAVFAEYQSEGRGRRHSSWCSPPCKSVLVTVAVPLKGIQPGDHCASWLGAVAVTELCTQLDIKAATKWPNDVVVMHGSLNGPDTEVRKIAGIIVETIRPDRSGAKTAWHLLGIGLNVNQEEDDFPLDCSLKPTSVYIETGNESELSMVAAFLLNTINSNVAMLRKSGGQAIHRKWESLSMMHKVNLTAITSEGRFECKFWGVTKAGDAIVRLPNGNTLVLNPGNTHFLLD